MAMLTNFIYCKSPGVIFAYVPKVACTNWKSILRYLAGQPDYLNAQLAHDRQRSGLVFLSDLPDSAALLADPGIFKMTFVRNPYTRILSAYLNKIKPFAIDNAPAERDPYFFTVFQEVDGYRRAALPELSAVTFGCFLSWLENSSHPMARNEHWIPQTDILGTGDIQFDFIGRMERLEHDVPIMLRHLGCDIPFPSQGDVKFAPTNARDNIPSYYSDVETAQVQRLFAVDFSVLGYAPEAGPSGAAVSA